MRPSCLGVSATFGVRPHLRAKLDPTISTVRLSGFSFLAPIHPIIPSMHQFRSSTPTPGLGSGGILDRSTYHPHIGDYVARSLHDLTQWFHLDVKQHEGHY